MKVIRKGSVPRRPGIKQAMGDQHVEVEPVISDQVSKELDVRYMRLFDGARTKLHTHSADQVLYSLEGKGLVGAETETLGVEAGDTVCFPVGEIHWHAAAPGQDWTLLSIMVPNELTVLE